MAKELHRAPESLSVWESNIRELRKWQPALARVVSDYAEKNGHEFAHFVTPTPTGVWIEGLTPKPFFQPHGEPKFAWNKKDKDKPAFFLYGAGSPPYLFKAIRALPKEAMVLLVVEPSVALIAYVLHLTHVYQAMRGGCRLFFVTETSCQTEDGAGGGERLAAERQGAQLLGEALHNAFVPLGFFAATLSKVTEHPGEGETFKEGFSRCSAKIREWVGVQLQYLGNSSEDTLLGMRQIALMSPWAAFGNSLAPLVGHFEDRPFVCVSAGPSLDKNIGLLRDIQDKCVIIAADAVLGKLLAEGIRPHIVTALERVVATYDQFFSEVVEKYREECENILLAAQALCIPRIAGRWPGPVAVVGKRGLPVDVWLVGDIIGGQILESGTSVAHMNYCIASIFGASAIAIIGQDLAYADDGSSHAGGIKGNWKVEDGPQPDVLEVPGALGGMVRTTPVWLSFLRLLERYIQGFGRPTWDCTEGGARIAGATVTPLAEFIEDHVRDAELIEKTPAVLIAENPAAHDRARTASLVRERIAPELIHLERILSQLDEVEELMEKTAAAGLEPRRRVAYAARAGVILDHIHGHHDVLSFITQSYTSLASIELSQTRSLEAVEEIERWFRLHKDIVEGHRQTITFMKEWLRYVDSVLPYYAEKDLELRPLEADEAEAYASRLLEGMLRGDNSSGTRFELDAVMARCDPVRLGWGPHILWNLALLLSQDGRTAEAVTYMRKAAEELEDREMPVSDMVRFFKDYARMLSAPDLCCRPQYHEAEVMIANAVEQNGGVDDEIRELLENMMDGQVSDYEALRFLGQGAGISDWFRMRAIGQKELYAGNLDKSLLAVWRAICAHYEHVPGWAASHLDWLLNTIEKLLPADDSPLGAAAGLILNELAENAPLLLRIPLPYSARMIEELSSRGLNASVVPMQERKETPVEAEGKAAIPG